MWSRGRLPSRYHDRALVDPCYGCCSYDYPYYGGYPYPYGYGFPYSPASAWYYSKQLGLIPPFLYY